MIDVSDGLGGDALQLAKASNRRIVIDQALLKRALPEPLVALCAREGWPSLELGLHGGEDYALLATGPAKRRPRGVAPIGWVQNGRGVVLRQLDGSVSSVGAGYDHVAGDGD
jgi:thiamine monophosphate kinase